MAGIGLVFNPRAGGNRRDPGQAARLARKLGDRGVVAAPRTLDELARVAEDFRKQRIDVLGIAGGDGTNHVTLTHFQRAWGSQALPPVALLRGGTMNTVANSLGLPRGRPEGLLDRLVRRYLETPALRTRTTWMLDVDGQLGFLWGLGVVPAYLREYYATGAPSPWTAVKTLGRAIASAAVRGPMIQRMTESVHVDVSFDDGARWETRPWFAVAAGTVPDLGLGFRPFHRAFEREAHFHLLGIHTSPLGFVADLPRIHRMEAMQDHKAVDRVCLQATVRRTKGSGPLLQMMDGDVVESTASEVTLRVGPALRIATMN